MFSIAPVWVRTSRKSLQPQVDMLALSSIPGQQLHQHAVICISSDSLAHDLQALPGVFEPPSRQSSAASLHGLPVCQLAARRVLCQQLLVAQTLSPFANVCPRIRVNCCCDTCVAGALAQEGLCAIGGPLPTAGPRWCVGARAAPKLAKAVVYLSKVTSRSASCLGSRFKGHRGYAPGTAPVSRRLCA